MRSIRRLDGHRATPLVIRSLHFAKDEDIDAYNFPPEVDSAEDFSESEYGADSTISREWTLSPKSISELEDNDIHIANQKDASELEDEIVRCKPQQWTEYPKSENVEVCTTPLQQSASDVDEEIFSPETQPLSALHQFCSESDNDLKDDVPLKANNPKPRPFSCVHQSHPEPNDDLKDDEPLEANYAEPRPFSRVYQSHPESDDGQKDDEPIEANNPEPQPFSPVHQSHSESEDSQKDDEPLEASSPEPRPFFPVNHFRPEYDNDPEDDALGAESPEPRKLLPAHQFYSEFDYYHRFQQDDESLEAHSPETLYEPAPAPQMEILCPKPSRHYPTHKVILEPELFEDWFVDMSEPIFIDEEEAISPEQSIPETPSPEPQNLFPVRCYTPHPEINDDRPHKANSPEPRRFVPVYDFHPTLYHPQPVLELDHEGLESLEILSFYQ